jgi:hypothetical protein
MPVHEVINFSLTLGTAVSLFLSMQCLGFAVVRYFNSDDVRNRPGLRQKSLKLRKPKASPKTMSSHRPRSAVLKTKPDSVAAIEPLSNCRESHLLRKHADLPIHRGNGNNRKAA